MLTARVEILGSRPSPFNPATGVVQPKCTLSDAEGNVVFSMVLHSIFQRRPAACSTAHPCAAEDPVVRVSSLA